MKWLFYVLVFVYMFYRAVYGGKINFGVSVEPISYNKSSFLPVGSHKTVACHGASRNQKLEWVDPSGEVVKRNPKNGRIFAQEHYTIGRIPSLMLTFSNLQVQDSGEYKCRNKDQTQDASPGTEVSVCVIDPSIFVDTPPEVSAQLGRAITLTCQAKGLPEPSLIWSVNGQTLEDDDDSTKYRVTTKYNSQGFESLLTVMSLSPADSGTYSCTSVQTTSNLETCSLSQTTNITLNVNYGPVFDDDGEVKFVFGKRNQAVDLTCSANGFPLPAYRWFREDGDLMEVDQKLIEYSEDLNQATWSITANPSTFGQKFRCRAANIFGEADQVFTLLEMEKPKQPTAVTINEVTGNTVKLSVTWNEEKLFPVDGFQVQRLKTDGRRKPKESEWRRLKFDEIIPEEGFLAEVSGLEEETGYWMRIRATNDAGEGPWSDPILVETTVEQEEANEEEVTESNEETEKTSPESVKKVVEESGSSGAFYGIFFAGGILITAVVYMFAIRSV